MTPGFSYSDDQIILLVKKFVETEIRLLRAVRDQSQPTDNNSWNNRENKFRHVIAIRPGTPL
jgi:hypothetical protein